MTEQELRFVLSAQDEGLKKGIADAEKAIAGLENAVLDLGQAQLSYNTAAKRFVDDSGKFVGASAALNRLGLQTTDQVMQQVRAYDELIARYKSDAVLTRQLIQQKEGLLRQVGAVGRGLKSNTQIYFQAGQAISDFSVAGIRGAANNIEFLAASLGASAPLMIGISLAAATFFTFGDDIVKALTPIKDAAEDVRQSLSDVLKVIDTGQNLNLSLFDTQLPGAIENTKKQLEILEDRIRGSAALNDPSGLVGLGFFDRFLGTKEEIDRIGKLRGLLKYLEKEEEDASKRRLAREAAGLVTAAEANKIAGEQLKTDLARIVPAEKLKDISGEQLLLLAQKGELEKYILDLLKDENAEHENLRKKIAEIRGENERILSGKKNELDILKEQLAGEEERRKRLVKIREATEQIAKANATIQGAAGFQAGGQFGGGPSVGSVPILLGGGTLSNEELIARQKKRSGSNVLRGEFLNEQLVKDYEDEQEAILKAQRGIIEGTDRTAEAFRKAGYDASVFYTTTREGQVALQETIAKSAGSIAGSFADLFQDMATSGQKGSQGLFVAYKAFATAQAIINTYQAESKALAEGGPILGPILAGAAIVQGGVLVTKIAATKPGDTSVSGGGGSARTPTVTAGGVRRESAIPSRAALSRPSGVYSGASRAETRLVVESVDSYTPAGDRIRSIRAALNTEKKTGGSGRLS